MLIMLLFVTNIVIMRLVVANITIMHFWGTLLKKCIMKQIPMPCAVQAVFNIVLVCTVICSTVQLCFI